MKEYVNNMNQTQMHNAQQVIPKLKTNRFASHLLELKRPKKKKVIKSEPPTCVFPMYTITLPGAADKPMVTPVNAVLNHLLL
jgi:hypothetical protein